MIIGLQYDKTGMSLISCAENEPVKVRIGEFNYQALITILYHHHHHGQTLIVKSFSITVIVLYLPCMCLLYTAKPLYTGQHLDQEKCSVKQGGRTNIVFDLKKSLLRVWYIEVPLYHHIAVT